jgi:hypothetical protein
MAKNSLRSTCSFDIMSHFYSVLSLQWIAFIASEKKWALNEKVKGGP